MQNSIRLPTTLPRNLGSPVRCQANRDPATLLDVVAERIWRLRDINHEAEWTETPQHGWNHHVGHSAGIDRGPSQGL